MVKPKPFNLKKTFERLYANLNANPEWISDLHSADAVIVATHSQGCIVSTHLLDRLIRDGHIVTARNEHEHEHEHDERVGSAAAMKEVVVVVPSSDSVRETRKVQRVCCLALCGIHLGPLRYLGSSTLVGPYLQVRVSFSFFSCWRICFDFYYY
jgi:hypothetical protein